MAATNRYSQGDPIVAFGKDDGFFLEMTDGLQFRQNIPFMEEHLTKRTGKSPMTYVALGPYRDQAYIEYASGSWNLWGGDDHLFSSLQNNGPVEHLAFGLSNRWFVRHTNGHYDYRNLPNDLNNVIFGGYDNERRLRRVSFDGDGGWWAQFEDGRTTSSGLTREVREAVRQWKNKTTNVVLGFSDKTEYFISHAEGHTYSASPAFMQAIRTHPCDLYINPDDPRFDTYDIKPWMQSVKQSALTASNTPLKRTPAGYETLRFTVQRESEQSLTKWQLKDSTCAVWNMLNVPVQVDALKGAGTSVYKKMRQKEKWLVKMKTDASVAPVAAAVGAPVGDGFALAAELEDDPSVYREL
ncbi:hypothetical protein HK097_007847 [Rhizophlyctis rosea]|uniref:Uncharacterized protein n=1 Tax=Rhizophlyctis rosea TaxID=64517 RepID=A0AAD5X4Y5_9FUNG|nr:hypothetical protein HK097_007847 [Rhizophlyctis rosea]